MRIDKDWNFPNIFRQTPGFDGRWGDVQFTTDPVSACDLLVVLNGPQRDIRVRCPDGARWLFTQESPVEEYRWQTDSFVHFDRLFTFWEAEAGNRLVGRQTALPWHIGRSYSELKALRSDPGGLDKKNAVSWVTSNATHKAGHKLRMAFMQHLRERQFEFDLFGRGYVPIDDKFDGIHPYRYSIAIENYACPNYWTEKIADCFLSWTMPIYWGATNILDYFPPESMILIDPAQPERALETVKEALATNRFARNFDALKHARDLVLDRYQFFPYVCQLISEFSMQAGAPGRKHKIPTNPAYYARESQATRLGRGLKGLVRDALWSVS